MSLIKCSECGKDISSYAASCPNCGKPMGHTSVRLNENLGSTPMQNENIKCPKCGSSQISANKKGFSAGKAVAGAVVAGGIGLAVGGIGSDNVIITCLKCGNQFKPGSHITKENPSMGIGGFIFAVSIIIAILIPACGGSWWFLLIMPIIGFPLGFFATMYKESKSNQNSAKDSAEVFKKMK